LCLVVPPTIAAEFTGSYALFRTDLQHAWTAIFLQMAEGKNETLPN